MNFDTKHRTLRFHNHVYKLSWKDFTVIMGIDDEGQEIDIARAKRPVEEFV